MKLTDIFRGIDEIGKEVRFYPKLNVITGSNNASLLLCYLIGWYGCPIRPPRTPNPVLSERLLSNPLPAASTL